MAASPCEPAEGEIMGSDDVRAKQVGVGSTKNVLSLLEEEARVSKREVVTGRVRVRTVTDTTEELVRQELQGEHIEVERVPIDTLLEPGAPPPKVRTEGNVTILPVLEEILVVEKRLLIKEELRIVRQTTKEVTEVPVALRKQRAVVERLNSEGELITDPTEKRS
jgi:uncharacterized protein (TIGR02271 family)